MKMLFIVIPALLILGCSEQQKSEEKQAQTATQVEKKEVAAAPVKAQVVKSAPVVKRAPVVEAMPVKEKKTEVVEAVAKKSAVEVKKVETEVVPAALAVIKKDEVDGATIFPKCTGCHGQHAEKSALGKSQIIKGWNQQKIVDAIHGYKDGTYGGAMKAVMKGQVSNLTDAEVDAVAKYISKL